MPPARETQPRTEAAPPMLFCSQLYLVFLAAVLLLYWATPWREPRVWLLLVASFIFYASWNHWLALLVFATALMDYAVALGMVATAVPWRRRLLLLLSLTVNLGVLVYFKYANFFLDSLRATLEAAGVSA